MLTLDQLKTVIRGAMDGRAPVEIERLAKLPAGTVSTLLRENKVPSVERAAHILDVLGLELCIRRKRVVPPGVV